MDFATAGTLGREGAPDFSPAGFHKLAEGVMAMLMQLLSPKAKQVYDTILLGVFQKQPVNPCLADLNTDIKKVIQLGDVSGKSEELHLLYPHASKVRRVILCGLGERKKLTLETIRKAIGRAMKKAKSLKIKKVAVDLDSFTRGSREVTEIAQAMALATTLSLYRFKEFISPKPEDKEIIPIVSFLCQPNQSLAAAVKRGEKIGENTNFVRTLANRPGNKLFPEMLAQAARALARRNRKVSIKILHRAELQKAGLGALLAVGAGSIRPPVLIELNYQGNKPGTPAMALIGKGITFDSGGICLKPSAKMEEMRFDMSGAAAVMGIIQAAAQLKLPVNLLGVIPAAENLPSGSALKPGDIVKSLSGQTIEVLNTDAEGRLVLADALTYAQQYRPSCIVDMATLTGAVVVALGQYATGLLSNNEKMAREFQIAGEASGERVWRLPLWEEYREMIKSDVADMANISSKMGAGTIIGAIFLEKFIRANTPWVHLDIAGTAYGEEGPVFTKGATGVGVRLVLEWLLQGVSKNGTA